MNSQTHNKALRLFLILSGLFIAALVTCNLIFLKFFQWKIQIFDFNYTFVQSVGLLPYPVTFLVTDIISEVYGKKKAGWVVTAGFFASIFMLLIVIAAQSVPVFTESPVRQNTFNQVFGLSAVAVAASMTAYLVAQMIDVRIFHFWKSKTNGKYLWLRNNFSTIFSQFIDTFLVVGILYEFDKLPNFWLIFLNGFLFKIGFALLDTPIIYLVLYFVRKHLGLKFGEEVKL